MDVKDDRIAEGWIPQGGVVTHALARSASVVGLAGHELVYSQAMIKGAVTGNGDEFQKGIQVSRATWNAA